MFVYTLPPELIAQAPLGKRDEARLLLLSRSTGDIRHLIFKDIAGLFDRRHLIVLNNTRVFPGRLFGRSEGGGRVEILLVREKAPLIWEALGRPAHKIKKGRTINFDHGHFQAVVLEDGERKLLKFIPHLLNLTSASMAEGAGFSPSESVLDMVFKYGLTPLPHYIKTPERQSFGAGSCMGGEEFHRLRYQTVYAKALGSCACPTAGLHFSPELLDALKKKAAKIVEITLHIGPGTFRPIRGEPDRHLMEEESFSISEEAAHCINSARYDGVTIIAVGTSTVRALEAASPRGRVNHGDGSACIFIRPGYRFKIVDALITNFHQPNSPPLAMTAAFAGESLLTKAYKEAVEKKYRFLSYGDSMLIMD